MQKIRLVCYSNDEDYINYFSDFLKQSEYINKVSCIFYTSVDDLYESTKDKKYHVLLHEGDIEEKYTLPFEKVIRISDGLIKSKTKTIGKYQPFDKTLSNVVSNFYDNKENTNSLDGNLMSETIAFYSASGGSGKTIASLCLAKHLSNQNKKIFYISFEPLQITNIYLSNATTNSSEIFYYMKHEKEMLYNKIEELKATDQITNIDYFNIPTNSQEILHLTGSHVNTLVEALRRLDHYDYIIVDLSSDILDFNLSVIDQVDNIYWISDNSESSIKRNNMAIEEEILGIKVNKDRLIKVINHSRFVNRDFLTGVYDIELPYMEHWSELSEKEKLHDDISIGEKLETGLLNKFTII